MTPGQVLGQRDRKKVAYQASINTWSDMRIDIKDKEAEEKIACQPNIMTWSDIS